MADNLAVTPGSGATIATDEVTWGGSTVHVPLGKLIIGADNAVETISRGQQTMANSLPVAIASNQGAVSVDSELPAAAALADATANPTVPTVGSAALFYNGTTWDRVRGDTTNGIDVDVTRVSGNVTVVNAGTFAVQVSSAIPAGTNNIGDVDVLTVPAPLSTSGTGTAAAALRVVHASDDPVTVGIQLLDDTVATNGAAIVTKSMQVAGSDGTNAQPIRVDTSGRTVVVGPTAVGSALATNPVTVAAQVRTSRRSGASTDTVQSLTLDDIGNLVIRDTAFAGDIWSYSAAVTGTTTQNVKALASGLRQFITGMQFTNDSGSSLRVTVQDTSATVLWRGLVPTGGGIVVPLPKPLMTASGVGVDLVLGSTPGGTVPSGGTAAVLCNLQGYQGV